MPCNLSKPVRLDMSEVLHDREFNLYSGILAALMALPASFSFPHPVSGIRATDLFNLNGLIGAAIEDQVVEALNRSRPIWDPDHEWEACMFVRRSQSFPDVRLVSRSFDGEETVMGIELKGWYALSKESVPSFRYQIAADACAEMDLICVVPWYLDNAVSGEAKVLTPWIEQAKFAAEWRDYWWTCLRRASCGDAEKSIVQPSDVSPYPSKAESAHAVPANDSGGNFGRLPRCKPLMDEFVSDTLKEEVLGIPLRDWVWFIALHTDESNPEEIAQTLLGKIEYNHNLTREERSEELLGLLRKLTNDFDFGV